MKTLICLSPILFLMACSSASSENEIEAIKKAIELETSSFIKVDRAIWEGTWVQSPYAYWSYSDSTGTSFLEGWERINTNFESYFKDHVPNRNIDVAHPEEELTIERDYREFRVYEDGAYVQYTQRVKDSKIERAETSQIRILEKQNGKWLVTYVGIIEKYPAN